MSFFYGVCYLILFGVWAMHRETRAQESWQVRLVGGTYESEGRVEVFLDNHWGTICDSLWGIEEATVVCRQLNYIGADRALVAGQYGNGNATVWLDKVQCNGTETNLSSCAYAAAEPSRCDHGRDAGVLCTAQGSLRLADGETVSEGRVEIMNETEVWGTICKDRWDLLDASVACRQLGYPEALEAIGEISVFGPGSGPILLDELQCTGREMHLRDCATDKGWGVNDCTHQEDAGLRCLGKSIRLAASTYPDEGQIEVYYGGTWGWVCAHGWTIEDAHVACRELGFPLGARTMTTMDRRVGPVLLDSVACSGNETSLGECPSAGWANNENCLADTGNSAGVICNDPSAVVELLSGSTSFEGVVEHRETTQIGLICDPNWSNYEAEVVCRQLGYESGTNNQSVTLGLLSGSIFFRDYRCEGDEAQLSDCDYVTMEQDTCNPQDIAQVSCGPPKDYDIRLAGSDYTEQGRVDVFLDGQWGAIKTDYPRAREAVTVCHQLGYRSAFYDFDREPIFGTGPERVAIDYFDCGRSYDYYKITDCTISLARNNTSDASSWVNPTCIPYESVANHPVRLIDRQGEVNNQYGRVEIYHDGRWGSVCNFDSAAELLCRQLGHDDVTNSARLNLAYYDFPEPTGPVWYSDTNCYSFYSPGVELDELYECSHSPWGMPHYWCTSDWYLAGVECVNSITISPVTNPPTRPPPYIPDDNSPSGQETGIIVGLVFIGLFCMLILICCLYRFCSKQKPRAQTAPTTIATYSTTAVDHRGLELALEASSPPPAYEPCFPPPMGSPPTYDSVTVPTNDVNNPVFIAAEEGGGVVMGMDAQPKITSTEAPFAHN